MFGLNYFLCKFPIMYVQMLSSGAYFQSIFGQYFDNLLTLSEAGEHNLSGPINNIICGLFSTYKC